MFLIVGKGAFMKDALLEKLREWGFKNPDDIVKEAEKKGKYLDGIRILHVRV